MKDKEVVSLKDSDADSLLGGTGLDEIHFDLNGESDDELMGMKDTSVHAPIPNNDPQVTTTQREHSNGNTECPTYPSK